MDAVKYYVGVCFIQAIASFIAGACFYGIGTAFGGDYDVYNTIAYTSIGLCVIFVGITYESLHDTLAVITPVAIANGLYWTLLA